jgi:trigger factor
MEVTETGADGLKREFRIVVPADELEKKVVGRLDELGRTIRLPGFRPGKVPMQILRRRYGSSILGEVLENTVQDSSADTMRERNLRPALPPKFDIVSFSEGADLEYNMMVEVLPEIPEPDFGNLEIERLVVEVPEKTVAEALQRVAEQQRTSETVERAADNGDILVVDVEGRIGDEVIPGTADKDRQIILGAGGLVPGFEEQLVGTTAGEHREVHITFPDDYAVSHLAGKEALFEVDVKEVRQRSSATIDDSLAAAVGLENLAELREELRHQIEGDYSAVARLRLKRELLDKLSDRYDFPVPAGMVDLEFETIWRQRQAEREREQASSAGDESAPAAETAGTEGPSPVAEAAEVPQVPEAAGVPPVAEAAEVPQVPEAAEVPQVPEGAEAPPVPETVAEIPPAAEAAGAPPEGAAAGDQPEVDDDAADKAEYRQIAERRVRLGLLLAEVGRSNNITVTQEELNRAITREVRRHPGYERQALDFYRQNPEAVASLRGPIFEDKVVDFIVEMAKVPERRVTPEELLGLPESEGSDAAVAGAPANSAIEPSA